MQGVIGQNSDKEQQLPGSNRHVLSIFVEATSMAEGRGLSYYYRVVAVLLTTPMAIAYGEVLNIFCTILSCSQSYLFIKSVALKVND